MVQDLIYFGVTLMMLLLALRIVLEAQVSYLARYYFYYEGRNIEI
jgi:hypothetical protein